jgi:hypothetical protein
VVVIQVESECNEAQSVSRTIPHAKRVGIMNTFI